MTSFCEGYLLKRKRISVLLLVGVLLISYFINIDMNARAQPDNVYVDGYVLENGSGTIIENATVILQNTQDGTTNSTTTNSTGYYNITIYSPPGGEVFQITIFHEDYLTASQYIWLNPGNPQNLDFYLDLAMNKNSYVHGEIYDAVTMSPLPFTRIAALGENYINTTSSDTSGYFWMALESNYVYYVQAELNGYENQVKSSHFGFGDNRSFNFYMEPLNCTLKGYIKNPEGPLGFANIRVYRVGETRPTEYFPEVNSTTGYFDLNLSRGVWQVQVEEGMHYSQTLSVLMFNGKTTWQNFTLAKLTVERATVQGYVRYYHNGSGIPGAYINAQNQNRTWDGFNSSNGTGWYVINVLPGKISLDAWSNQYGGKRTTIITQNGGTYYLNLTLIDFWSYGYLEGYLRVNGTGEPDVGVSVSYGNWRNDQKTDAFGYYNISVPGGPLEVQAYKEGFKPVITQINTKAPDTNVLNMDMVPLNWTCELRGYINDTNGKPIEEAFASFDYDGYGWDSATAITDYTGLYQRMAPLGIASTFIFADGYEYKTGEVNLPSNEIFWYNETLSPVDMEVRIICRFTDIYSGKPIKHAQITFSEQDLQWFSTKETDKNGMVKDAVPSGFVRVSFNAWESGYKNPGMDLTPSTMQFLLSPSEIKWLNISLFPRDKHSLIHGFVNDTGANPIPGATVYVQYGDTIISNVSDGSGYYKIPIPGDQWIQAWVRAPGYRIKEFGDMIGEGVNRWLDVVLGDSPASIGDPITDSVVDLDGDTMFDFLYVNVTVNVNTLGDYRLRGTLAEGRNSRGGIASAEVDVGGKLGLQVVTLAFMGEQIRNANKDGYCVYIELYSASIWERYDKTDYFTAHYGYEEFEKPVATIMTPVEHMLVDTDLDGLSNYLIINVTLNVSEAGDYTLLGLMRDIWGNEFEMTFESFSLETGQTEVQLSFDGTAIYNNGKTLGSIYLVLFEGFPSEGSNYIHTLFFYTPFEHEIFQFYNIDSFISGYVTDMNNQPIQGMMVCIYNITQRFLNETKTDDSGYYELGGWSGDWILVVNDYEDNGNLYQGDLTEMSLSTGMINHDFLNLPYTMLDEIKMQLVFSEWNNTHLDWLLYAIGDNKTIRFDMDVRQFGDGDGFVSEEEVEYVMGMIGTLNLPADSSGSFLVDGIWYDLNQSSVTRDAGLVGHITSKDPIYIHLTGDYTANSTIPDPSPHDLTLNCSYDDTDSGSFIGNNVTNIYHIVPPNNWGRTGNGMPLNVTISGSDYITVDPQNDPIPGDMEFWEWVNMTISLGIISTTGTIKGNVTLDGGSMHSGVEVTAYDNSTGFEIGKGHTNPSGYFEITGLPPGNYDIVAHKAGYKDNWSFDVVLSAGDTLWLDFILYSYPPIIVHSPVVSALLGNSINVVADVSDDGQVGEVLLYYKDVGSSVYSYVTMSKIPSTSTYMGTIPAQSMIGYVDYYIWANDTKGNSATHPAAGNHSIYIYELNPPEFSNIIVSPDPAEYPAPVNVSVLVSDDTNVEHVGIFIEMPDLSTVNLTMDYDLLSGRYYLNSSYSILGIYSYTIWANDSFDNWNSSSGSFVIQDTISPTSSVDWISQYWYTSLPIPIDASASESGIGVDFVELWYRHSPDNTSWGLWTYYQTDSSSPYQFTFTFPDGEGYYEFFSIATDYASNSEAMKTSYETLVGYDTSGPVSNVGIIDFYWQTASPLTINAAASESISTLENVTLWYKFSSDNISWSAWAPFGADTSSPYSWNFNFPEGEGFYEFFSIAFDIVGNPEPMKFVFEALCGYDTSSPSSNIDGILTYWHTASPIIINATASDAVSGVKGVMLYYRFSLDNSSWGIWTAFGSVGALPYKWTFDFPDGQGYYEFFCIANDSAGHIEAMKSSSEAICGYDTSMPNSYVQAINPYLQTSSPITLDVTASDTGNEVVSVNLWYQFSVDNSNWSLLTIYDTDYSFPWTFSFDFSDGEGYYEFRSTATDLAGLTEGVPVSADTSCVYDTTIPSFLSAIELPDSWELGAEYNLSILISDVYGIGGAWMDITLGGANVGNFSMDNSGQNYWYTFAPMDVGTLLIKVSAKDANGLWNSVSYTTEVTDTTPPTISSYNIYPSSPEAGSNVRVNVNVSDDAGISSCRIKVTSPKGNLLFNESMTYDFGTRTYYHETVYAILGDYDIVIWAVDGNGLGSKFTNTLTTFDTQPPSANAGPVQDDVTAGTTVTLDAGSSTDNINITNYTWRFQDNGLKRLYGKVVQYTFITAKNYEINLTVWDESGNWDYDITWVNVTAVSGTGTITGIVRDKDGNPIEGATVYIEGNPQIENITDSLGRFTLENVPVGTQTIIVEKEGYKWTSKEVNVEQDQITSAGNIELAKSVSEEEGPWLLFGAIIAIVVILVLILLFLLMQKKKAVGADTLIDEVFFMYNDGRLIKHFTRRLKPDMDEDILSSMLVAVQDFVKDSFKDQEGVLDEMKFGRFQVLLGRGKYIILATIILGDEVEPFRPQIAQCVQDIEEKYGDVLEDWDGEMASVRGATKYIVDLIDGKYA